MNTNYLNISALTPLTSHLTNVWQSRQSLQVLYIWQGEIKKKQNEKEIKSGKKKPIHLSQVWEAYLEVQQHNWCNKTAGRKESFWLSVGVQQLTGLSALKDALYMRGEKREGHQESCFLLPSHKACGCTMELLTTGNCEDWKYQSIRKRKVRTGPPGALCHDGLGMPTDAGSTCTPCCQRRAEAEPMALCTASFLKSFQSICIQPQPRRRSAQETLACPGTAGFMVSF